MFKIWIYSEILCICSCMPGILTFDLTLDVVWCWWTNGISDHSPIYLLVFVNSFASHLLTEQLHQDQEFAATSIIIQDTTGSWFFFYPTVPSGWKDDISSHLSCKWWQCNPIARQYSITQIFRTVSVELLPSHSQVFQRNPSKTARLVRSLNLRTDLVLGFSLFQARCIISRQAAKAETLLPSIPKLNSWEFLMIWPLAFGKSTKKVAPCNAQYVAK